MHTFNSLYPIRRILLVLFSFISFYTIIAGNVISFSSIGLEDGIVRDTLFKNEKVTLAITNGVKCQYNAQEGTLVCPRGTVFQISANDGEMITGMSFYNGSEMIIDYYYDYDYEIKKTRFSFDTGEFEKGIWNGHSNTVTFECLRNISISEIRVSFSSDSREAYAVGVHDYYDYHKEYRVYVCYDEHKNLYESNVFTIDGEAEYPEWYNKYIGNMFIFDSSFADFHPKRTSHWFENKSCTILGLEYLNTSEVVDMSYMFANFTYQSNNSYKSLFDILFNEEIEEEIGNYTPEAMNEKFISSIFELFDFSNVQDMSYMFSSCSMDRFELSSLHIPNTANSTGMFQNCNLKYVTIKTNNISLNYNFFDGIVEDKPCVIDSPSDFDFNTNTNSDTFKWKGGWFKGFQLQPYVVERRYVSSSYRTTSHPSGAYWNNNNTDISLTFYFDNRINTHGKESFTYLYSPDSIYDDNGEYSYRRDSASVSITIHHLNEDNKDPSWINIDIPEFYYHYAEDYSKVRLSIEFDESFAEYEPKTTYRWFDFYKEPNKMTYLYSFTGLQYLNTSETTNAERMFYGLNVEQMDLSHLDLSKAINTTKMVGNCFNLKELYVNPTMSGLDSSAFWEVGNYAPCVIHAPEGFNFETNTNNDRFCWKSGNFILPNVKVKTKAYAVLNNDTLTLYYDSKFNERGGAVYDIERMEIDYDEDYDDGIGVYGYVSSGTYYDNFLGDFSLISIKNNYNHLVIDSSFANKLPGETIGWFAYNNGLENILGLENINSTSMYEMFYGCKKLESLDLSKMDMSRTDNTDYMFWNCSSLSQIAFPSTCKKIGDCAFLRTNLTSIDIPNSVISIGKNAFFGCENLASVKMENPIPIKIDESSFPGRRNTTLYVPAGSRDAYLAADYWKDFKEIIEYSDVIQLEPYLSISQDGKVATFYYDNLKEERPGMVFDLDGYKGLGADTAAVVTKVVFDPSFAEARPTSTYLWFYNMKNLASIEGMEYLNTSEVTSMRAMFSMCSSLTSLDLSHFDTSNVTTMRNMFYYCSGLTSLDLSLFDTSEVTTMQSMFNGCSSLSSVDVSGFNTSKLTSMEGMFHRCSSLKALDLSHFNTSNVTSTYMMFNKCSSLTSLDVSSFDMSKVTKTSSMFGSCSSLKNLSISGSMDVLDTKACNGVGTQANPCLITAPEDFDFGDVNIYGTFQWKAGWFKLANTGFSSCTLMADAVSLSSGSSASLVLGLDNGDEKISAFQFDITLPEGVTLAEDGNGFACTLADRCNGMRVRIVENQERCYSLMAFFLDYAKSIEGTSGPVVTLTLKAEDDLSDGDLEGVVDNIVLTNLSYDVLKVAPVTFPITISKYPMGDVNHDGDVNVADVMMTVSEILGKKVEGFHIENADVNGDGSINITDVIGIVDIVLYHLPNNAPALATSDCISAVHVPGGLDLRLENASRYTALEMTVELPQGATLTRASLCKSTGHQVKTRNLGGGLHRVVVYSLSGEPLAEGDALLHFDIIGGGDMKIGNVVLASTFFEALSPNEATGIIDLAGDSNDAPTYNIQGMKVTNPGKGVYIRNNQKVIVK